MNQETNGDIVAQEWIEEHYNRKHIDAKIKAEIEGNPGMVHRMEVGISYLNDYIGTTYSYASKNMRVAQLKNLKVKDLVLDLFVGIAYVLKPVLFTSVTAQLAARLKFDDKTDAITTVAEMLSVLAATDAFDITKQSKMASLMLVSRIPLSAELVEFIEQSEYLPPMVCEPLELVHNYSSGYLTHNDSLILGQGNHHDGDLCLDVLNTMNKVALKLDTDFLSQIEEEPTEITEETIKEKALKKGKYLTDADAKERVRAALENWYSFKKQSYHFYSLMAKQGNRFFLTHKVDKRGRIYACGYHINTQGASFKKAVIDFDNEEVITGVPT